MESEKIEHRLITGSSGALRRTVKAGLSLLACLPLLGGLPRWAHAAHDGEGVMPQIGVYAPDQTSAPDQADGPDQADTPGQAGVPGQANAGNNGPIRLARFSYLKGEVSWRPDAQSDWSPAASNLPLRQGAQIWVGDTSRAEIQLDDGSRVRLDNNTLITLQTLYSDTDGEFTEITLNEGEVFLRLTTKFSLYQVNTPEASVKAAGPARVRVGAGEGAQFAVRSGQASIDGPNGKIKLQEGDYLDVVDHTTPYEVGALPQPDAWDTWNDARDRQIDDPDHVQTHLPSNIALVAGNLNAYGRWVDDPTYGWIWVPTVTDPNWRPYSAGHWTWVEPFGWTWVADEPWGWAPYHYGTWASTSYGWAWCPGPATQYWSPAVVSFYQSGTRVAWCPLAPREVVYPTTLAVGFRSANWSLYFSIGGAAVYYPGPDRVCVARPWSAGYVNRVSYVNVTNVTNVTNITINRNTYVTNTTFVPSNARFQGGSEVEVSSFGASRAAVYRPVTGAEVGIFTRGRAIGAPAGGSPVAGPQSVPVTAQSFTPTRSFRPTSPVPSTFVNRSVYRASLPARVPAAVATPQSGQRFVTRSTPTPRPNGVSPSRTNTPSGSTGRSSALEEYLRERDAARGGSSTSGGNSPAQPGSGTFSRGNSPGDTRSTDTSRTSPSQPGTPRSNPGGPGQSNPRSNMGSAGQSNARSYRQLHSRPTTPPRNNTPSKSGKDDRSGGGDRGH